MNNRRIRSRDRLLTNIAVAGVLLVVALSCLWPLAVLGFPAGADDTRWHFLYVEGFFDALMAGSIYPRWLPDVNGGLGAASFYFYGPVAYYLTSAAAAVTGLRDGLAVLAVASPLILFGSGLSAYAWLRVFLPAWPAGAGAALYMAAPYHLLVDFWIRGAFAEASAYLWIPLAFRAVEDLRAGHRRGLVLLPPVLALLAATHVIAAVLALAVLGVYAVVRLRTRRAWAGFAAGGAAGLAMAGIYLVPMALLQGEVVVPHVALDDGVFLFGPRAPASAQVFSARALRRLLDLLLLGEMACVLLLALAVGRTVAAAPRRRLALIWAGLTAAMLLATTIWFAPVWRALPVFNQVQFPFRLNSTADLGLATVAAFLIAEGAARRQASVVYVAVFVLAAAFGAGQALPALTADRFNAARQDWDAIRRVRDVLDAFRPQASAGRLPFDVDPTREPHIPRAGIASGTGRIRIERWRPGRIDLYVEMSAPGSVDVAQLWIGLWQASSDGSPLNVHPSPELGLVRIDCPAGSHRITLHLAASVAEQIGAWLSIAGLGGWVGLIVLALVRRPPTAHAPR